MTICATCRRPWHEHRFVCPGDDNINMMESTRQIREDAERLYKLTRQPEEGLTTWYQAVQMVVRRLAHTAGVTDTPE